MVFDTGYTDYQIFEKWCCDGVFFVTRLKKNAYWTPIRKQETPQGSNVLSDEVGEFQFPHAGRKVVHPYRKVWVPCGAMVCACASEKSPKGLENLTRDAGCGMWDGSSDLRRGTRRNTMRPSMNKQVNDSERPVRIVLGVTGSIAAYKAAELVRLMVGKKWEVSVVMTRAATRFVGELTFSTLSRRSVAVDMFAEQETWQPEHIALADQADVMLIAPCTANVMAKIAHGIADDLLTAVALATRAPIVLAPAMNEGMWDAPATQANAVLLRSRGVDIVDVGTGDLACGYLGKGRLAALDAVLAAVERRLQRKGQVVKA